MIMTLLLSLTVGQTPMEKPLEGTPVTIQGRAPWRAGTKPGTAPQHLVVRSADEFAKLLRPGNDAPTVLRDLLKAMKLDSIDWSRQMLVVVTGGAQKSGGYRLEITGVAVKGDVMTVRWKLHSPRPTDIVTMAFTHPAETVLVPSHAGTVVFDPPLKKPISGTK